MGVVQCPCGCMHVASSETSNEVCQVGFGRGFRHQIVHQLCHLLVKGVLEEGLHSAQVTLLFCDLPDGVLHHLHELIWYMWFEVLSSRKKQGQQQSHNTKGGWGDTCTHKHTHTHTHENEQPRKQASARNERTHTRKALNSCCKPHPKKERPHTHLSS